MLKLMFLFIFWYPAIMSMFWMIGGVWFYLTRERRQKLLLYEEPMVSILIPCYNEEGTIQHTIEKLQNLNYSDYEIIAINDGSSDKTGEYLEQLTPVYPNLRFIDLKTNRGKANALYLGLIAAKGEYLVSLDSDAYLEQDALQYLIPHFLSSNLGENVGAVTGNPKIRNRSSLLARIQICEFGSIIGLIKRSQRVLGRVMTVSGVVVAFRKRALLDCGLWDRDMITEDIAVTWKLEKKGWDIRYEPKAICWMLVPETLKGLWKQRVRWSQGGLEVLIRHRDIFKSWEHRMLLPLYIEQMVSILWSICWLFSFILIPIDMLIHQTWYVPFLWTGFFIAVLCMIQFLVSVILERNYDKQFFSYYIWAIWYPMIYWMFNAFTAIRAIIKVLFKKKGGQFAVWESPDRGL